MNGENDVVMFYKEWSSDDSWLPKKGLQFLDSDAVLNTNVTAIQPKYDKEDLTKLGSTIKKITCYLDEDRRRWWAEWLLNAKSYTNGRENMDIAGI